MTKVQNELRQKRGIYYRINGELREYKHLLKSYITTTRFTEKTWQENCDYRKRHPQFQCIYGACESVSSELEKNIPLLVLEMNNDTNQIMGIGMIRNIAHYRKHTIYSNEEYNRVSYVGKYRIDRSEMDEEEETVMKAFDILCFKGARHMKRLRGIKTFSVDVLFRVKKVMDLDKFVKNMFAKRLNV